MTVNSGSVATGTRPLTRLGIHTLRPQAGGHCGPTDLILAVKSTVLHGYLELGGSLNDGVSVAHPSPDVAPLLGPARAAQPRKGRGAFIFPLKQQYCLHDEPDSETCT